MATRNRQVVLAFDERSDLSSPRVRGGKGASLTDMRALGLPVPPGFTISTSVARAFMQHGVFPKRFEWQLARSITLLERATGKKFGDIKNPLLVSVRSGAEVSMPGMMDTILNLGMTPEIYESMRSIDREFADTSLSRFVSMYTEIILGEHFPPLVSGGFAGNKSLVDRIPRDPYEQLRQAIAAVIRSWNSPRAVTYRKTVGIKDDLGTAVTTQAMVFGNKSNSSGSGVVFSRNPNTGERGLYGEVLPGAQGEAIVSGQITPKPISVLRTWNEVLYNELSDYARKIETSLDAIADIEFTIEEGKLWLLQCRPAKLTAGAAATFAVHQVWDKRWSKEKALKSLTPQQLDALDVSAFAAEDIESAKHIGSGIAASSGAAVGMIARSSEEAVAMKKSGLQVVLLRPETTPNDLDGMLAASAIVTLSGGATSHAAVVARQLGIPAVVGVPFLGHLKELPIKTVVSVCGNTGRVMFGLLPVIAQERNKEVQIFLKWLHGNYPAPRINFKAVRDRFSVNRMLAEVYLLDAMAPASRGSAIGHEVEVAKKEILVTSAEFLACYLAIAVASELRHHRIRSSGFEARDEIERLVTEFKIHEEYLKGDEGILTTLARMSLEKHTEFFRLAAVVFGKTRWHEGYGGPKWAAIAEAGAGFLSGKLNHGVFVDHVFDLRHNRGVLFDKHLMTSKNTLERELHTQLDYKRAKYSLNALHNKLTRYVSSYGDPISIRFKLLWTQGLDLNLWKEEKNEPIRAAYEPQLRPAQHAYSPWNDTFD
ncbi:MAG: pyruvate, phosphate dikinase [Patescibacteria group bacterium]